jgi:hypothetical protein
MDTLFDNFDDRFLGTKTSNPSKDNDGNQLSVGAVYYNSNAGEVRFYNGASWDAPAAAAASSAQAAADSADSIKNLTAATGPAGTDASYNSSTGVLTVPKGDKGDTGATPTFSFSSGTLTITNV